MKRTFHLLLLLVAFMLLAPELPVWGLPARSLPDSGRTSPTLPEPAWPAKSLWLPVDRLSLPSDHLPSPVDCLSLPGDSLHKLQISTPGELKAFFRYRENRIPLVSAHRGGARPGFPENCLATFENTLKHVHALLEVDPRYTKDSVLVLMHDPTLDRTTNGTGRVSEYTWEELKKLRLKDPEGRLTSYRIPTLAEALTWAKGKTILVLDQKDVSVAARIKAIEEQNAETAAMLIVYSYKDAQKCYQLNPDLMMEVMMPDVTKITEFERTGVPWENIVAFVGHKKPEDKRIYRQIHSKGAMCIVGSSRIYDQDYLNGDKQAYAKLIEEGADIIEADLAIEAGKALADLKRNGASDKL